MDLLLILAHGIFGWGEDARPRPEGFRRAYFYGVRSFLTHYAATQGVTVKILAPTVSPSDRVETRGRMLRDAIEQELKSWPAGTRAHILAHSMGGLDARWAVAAGGLADQIASVTTIGTPHAGTTIGSVLAPLLPILRPIVKAVAVIWLRLTSPAGRWEFLSHLLHNIRGSSSEEIRAGVTALSFRGAQALTDALAHAEAALRTRTAHRVIYVAYGGVSQPGQIALLRVSFLGLRLFGREPKRALNDGAVAVSAASFPWEAVPVQVMPVDHFMQVNWRIPETRAEVTLDSTLMPIYQDIMDRLIHLHRGAPAVSQ